MGLFKEIADEMNRNIHGSPDKGLTNRGHRPAFETLIAGFLELDLRMEREETLQSFRAEYSGSPAADYVQASLTRRDDIALAMLSTLITGRDWSGLPGGDPMMRTWANAAYTLADAMIERGAAPSTLGEPAVAWKAEIEAAYRAGWRDSVPTLNVDVLAARYLASLVK